MSRSDGVAARLDTLCNLEEGTLSPIIFTDEQIFGLEMDRIFAKCWVMLCPEAQIPKPGDFFNTYVGQDRVLVVRQRDGSIRAMLNQCRHRGNELVRADCGHAVMFTCSYHGWVYDRAGNLRTVPSEDVVFPDGVDKSVWGCVTMPQVESYHGLVYGTWDPTAPPLADYLGEAAYYMDTLLDRFDGGLELRSGVNKWVVKANWKIIAEQFASDMYHPGQTHMSAFRATIPKDIDPALMKLTSVGRQWTSRQGHGLGLWTDGPILQLTVGPEIERYWNHDSYPEAVQRVGEARASVQAAHINVFPASIALLSLCHLRVLHPVSSGETEIWTWQVTPVNAPEHIKKEWTSQAQRAFGAGGLYETDDSAVWAGIQRTLRGTIGRRSPFNAALGNRKDLGPDDRFPGRIARRAYSEMASRGFYARWKEMLSHETWSEIDDAAEARFKEGVTL